MQKAFQHDGICCINLWNRGWIHSEKNDSKNITAKLKLCCGSQEGQTQRKQNVPSLLYGGQAARSQKYQHTALEEQKTS